MKLLEISPDGLMELQSRMTQAREGLDLTYFYNKTPEFTIDENGIAHIWLYGPLVRDSAPVERDLGLTDYKDVLEALEAAEANAKGVLLHVDSPGGTVAGNLEVAQKVASLGIPVVASIDGTACSAAYKIACGADYMVATPSSNVGNIGTITVWTDYKAAMAEQGIFANAIVNDGAVLKSTGHLFTLTEEQQEFLQESINEAGSTFKNHVLANRSVNPEVFKAGWYSGSKAIDLGLIDELGDEQTALGRLSELVLLTVGE